MWESLFTRQSNDSDQYGQNLLAKIWSNNNNEAKHVKHVRVFHGAYGKDVNSYAGLRVKFAILDPDRRGNACQPDDYNMKRHITDVLQSY